MFNSGRTRSLQWRAEQLRAIEKMCEESEPEIAEALARDLGRSAFEAWLGDVASTKAEAAFARKHLRKWFGRAGRDFRWRSDPAGRGCSTTRWA